MPETRGFGGGGSVPCPLACKLQLQMEMYSCTSKCITLDSSDLTDKRYQDFIPLHIVAREGRGN